MGALFTILIFILVLGVMIFVHELGHYIVAKRVGVKVLEFALGMGPKLFSRKRGETEYKICAVPIGGYLKMLGEEPGETDDEEIDPEERHRAFVNQPPHKRIAITVAGPILNIILAMILAPTIFLMGIDEPVYLHQKPVIYSVEEGSPAEQAGFEEGDEILKAGGKEFEKWEELLIFVALNPGKTLEFDILRDSQPMAVTMTIGRNPDNDIGVAGFTPAGTNVIGNFATHSPAREAGLKLNDLIVGINGVQVDTWEEIVKNIRSSEGAELTIDVIRDERPLSFKVTPEYSDAYGTYLIGISPNVNVKYPLGKSIVAGMKFLVEQLAMAGTAIKKLVTGELGRKALGGPFEIAYQIGLAARLGFSYLVKITAIISIWLGVINLFPFPALDGGHILFSGLEIISRRRLNQKVLDVMNQVGFALLITLILLVTVQDVARHWDGIIGFFKNIWS